jgi:bifunctional non-homologous end joining protein LigD
VSLRQYQAKRQFQRTPEPTGSIDSGEGPLRFVVQKHHASRLHYDFRLEADGTLKSWAVPKGPPVSQADKRLAVMVEDHPLDYRQFEGVIPKGNYGAGTVMVWDEGTYHSPGSTDREQSERAVLDGLQRGSFHVVLHGKKLRGEYILVKTKQSENSWLLFRKGAAASNAEQPTGEPDRSVLSGRTMEDITRGAPSRDGSNALAGIDLSDALKGPMPRNIEPMLATPVAEPFDDPDWLFEVKWDGYRAIAEIDAERIRLYSRNRLSFENRFAPIVDSLRHLRHQAVFDGEVVVLDERGNPQFQLLQAYQKSASGVLVYQVFDLLYLDGHDLRKLPLRRRKDILAQVIRDLPNIRLSEHVEEHGKAFYEAVSRNGLEGIVAKDARSRYREGFRSHSWLKIKTHLRQEAVIGGFTEPRGSRTGMGALLLGIYDNGDLIYIGHAGIGFSEQGLADLRSRLESLVQKASPFKTRPKGNAPVHWVQPRLVCEVSFAAWTDTGHMRHPVFLGLREDKEATTVRRERPQPSGREGQRINSAVKPPQPAETAKRANPANRQERIGGHVVSLTNLQKLYWPEDGYSKGDLIHYYRQVAKFILPHLKDRPQSLHRHPNGIDGKSFFQKDVSQQPPPEWVRTVTMTSESDGKKVRSILCQDEATLVYMANLGCIELNPWNSRIDALDQPDYVILDLDPEDIAFDRVIEAAQTIRKVLQDVGAEPACKTSGKRGLHVAVPFGAAYSHEQAKHFAELIARIVNARLPSTTSLVRIPSARQQRVYLDYLQNGKGKTLAAAYSVRPYPKATVSAPLKWTEVRRGLDPGKFTIRTMPKRLDAVGDLWGPILGRGLDLPACLDRLAHLLKRE